MEPDRQIESGAASPGALESSNCELGKDACAAGLQKTLGFKEKRATWAWVFLAGVMVVFSFAGIGLAFPRGARKLMAPGEYYHHRTRRVRLAIHVLSAFMWSVLGVVQFNPKVRKVALGYHRWGGRLYLICAAALATTGLMMTPYSFGGHLSGQSASIAICSLFTGSAVMGLVRVRQGFIPEHRAWMLRNFAIGASVLWVRITIPIGALIGRLHNYWTVMECSQVLYELEDKIQQIKDNFPECLTSDGSTLVVVDSDGPTMVNTIVGMRLGYDIGLWLGLLINLCGIELWIRYCREKELQAEKVADQLVPAADGEAARSASDPAKVIVGSPTQV